MDFPNYLLPIEFNKFQKIVKTLTIFWGHPEFIEYINDLMLPDRDDRSGFPPSVVQCLFQLDTLHRNHFPNLYTKRCVWTLR